LGREDGQKNSKVRLRIARSFRDEERISLV
jgi:hypothetical protein